MILKSYVSPTIYSTVTLKGHRPQVSAFISNKTLQANAVQYNHSKLYASFFFATAMIHVHTENISKPRSQPLCRGHSKT